jgi:hypothetical protein
MDHSLSTFLSGCARYHDFIFFAKSLDELAERDDQANSTFLMIDGATTARVGEFVGWTALAMAVIKVDGRLVVCALGPNGELWECTPADGKSVTGELGIGELSWRSMTAIGGEVYACGMGRTVAVRTGPLRWRDLGAPSPEATDAIIGFEDLDGYSADELYAVGWQGEIWQRKGPRWRRLGSPVSTTLNAVCCAEDGVVYAVGDGGVMVAGRDDAWRALATGVSENLQDVRDFGGAVYVVSDFALYELADGRLREVGLAGDDEVGTCLHLLKGDDGLISLGLKDVIKLHDGRWQRVV